MNKVSSFRQQGSALTVAVILLLLLTLAVFVAAPAILGEQRVSGNDVRAKIAQHAAEAGLNHGMEFLRLVSDKVVPSGGQPVDAAMWSSCTATDRSFPCGAIEPDSATSASRGNYYKYIGGNGRTVTFPAPGRLYDGNTVNVGNFKASYDVGLLLCRVTTTNTCTENDSSTVGTSLFTVISRGSIPGENATATVSETIGTYRIISVSPDMPPLIAAGAVQGVGTSTIVGNPNSGGFGIPLSIWTYNDFDANNGSWQTCQLDEYLRSNLSAVSMEGKNKDVPICLDCDCTSGVLSRNGAVEGVDILDRSGSDGGLVLPTAGTNPYYFPPDLFQYVLGFHARENKTGEADYDETLIDAGGVIGVPDVEEFLQANAIKVISDGDCSSLDGDSQGLIWVKHSGCTLPGHAIGSVDHPVVLVIDGDIDYSNGTVFYGILYGRATAVNSEDCIPASNSPPAGCPAIKAGGGKAKIFGTIAIEGGGKMNANIDLVFLPQIITNLNNAPENNRFAGLPGSWSDRVAY